MDPLNPLDAQQIVVEYARVLERDLNERRHPTRVDSLPFSKPTIRTAIRTSVMQLTASGRLTEELRQFLEIAYISLAEYVDPELATLMTADRQSADELTDGPQSTQEKTTTQAWRTLVESGALAGEVARVTTAEAEKLRSEFQNFVTLS